MFLLKIAEDYNGDAYTMIFMNAWYTSIERTWGIYTSAMMFDVLNGES